MFGECHGHIFMNGYDYPLAVKQHRDKPNEWLIRNHLNEYKKRGITFVRDGGDPYGAAVLAKKLAPEYGIDYRMPVFAIHKKGHYGSIVGRAYKTLREYHKLVLEAKEAGADFIKIMTTGIMDFDTDGQVTGEALPEEEVKELVHIAHEEGLAVMAHTNGAKAVADVAFAKVDSVEHGNFLDGEAIAIMAEEGTVWVPTVVTVANLIGEGRFSDQVLIPILEKARENIKVAYEAGVLIAVGSDAGAYCVMHGQGVMDEYEQIVLAVGVGNNLLEKKRLDQRLQLAEAEIKGRFRP